MVIAETNIPGKISGWCGDTPAVCWNHLIFSLPLYANVNLINSTVVLGVSLVAPLHFQLLQGLLQLTVNVGGLMEVQPVWGGHRK